MPTPSRLSDATRTPLDSVMELLTANPARVACILGHAGQEGGATTSIRLAAERAELERQQAEVRRQQDELAAQQAAEREAAERAEAERQAQERARAEEAERRRAEQERQHHEAAVEAATLREAANEALELLRQFVGEDNLTVRKLVAALNRPE